MTPRGIRNNNPGNLRHGAKWDGLSKEQSDPSFCTFDDPLYGIRALAKLLINYQHEFYLHTVKEIMNKYAPPSENDTYSYASHVAETIGYDMEDIIDIKEHLPLVVATIIHHENGQQPYKWGLIFKACGMACGEKY